MRPSHSRSRSGPARFPAMMADGRVAPAVLAAMVMVVTMMVFMVMMMTIMVIVP